MLPVYGGSSIESQIRALKRGVHIIVATPGRLLTWWNAKTVSLATIQNVVMDEADEMLNMGLTDKASTPFRRCAAGAQHLAVLRYHEPGNRTHSQVPARCQGNHHRTQNESTSNVKHVAFCVHAKDKYVAPETCDHYPQIYGIIFCRTRKRNAGNSWQVDGEGYNADRCTANWVKRSVSDDAKFRIRNLQLLAVTDVAPHAASMGRRLRHTSSTTDCPLMTPSYTHAAAGTCRQNRDFHRHHQPARERQMREIESASSARNSLQAKCPPANRYAKSNCSKW